MSSSGGDSAFDIETETWDTFAYGGIADDGGGYFDTSDPAVMFDRLYDQGGTVWTWNGGRFDLIWVTDEARARGLKMQIGLAGTRITRARINGSPTIFRDAMALWPTALAKAIRFVPELERKRIYGDRDPKHTGLVCDCELAREGTPGCGGYCRIRANEDMPAAELAALRLYLEGDCRGLLAVVQAVREEYTRCGYYMGGTVGGSAYRTVASWIDLPNAEWKSMDYRFARKGYYGGRTQVFRPQASTGHRYDIHSAYPAALARTPLPTGECARIGGDRARKAYAIGHEGIYHARATVPRDMYIPPLPWRSRSGRVCYPTGTIRGTWTGPELRYAESIGVKVEIADGLVWLESAPILAEPCRRIWGNRDAFPPGHPGRDLHKWFANSVTGKLAEKPDKTRVILHPSKDEILGCSANGPCTGIRETCRRDRDCCVHRCTGRCKKWKQIGGWSGLWAAPFWRISDCGHVHWAAYLTAVTRVELHRQLVADGQGGRTALYCDTDSCYSSVPRDRRIGDDLGQWGYEGELSNWLAAAPKAYRYRDLAHECGDKCAAVRARGDDCAIVSRCKGLEGLSDDEWQRWFEGETISRDSGVFGLRDAARRDLNRLFHRRHVTRSRIDPGGLWYGDRIARADGFTYPVDQRKLRDD